MTDDPSQVHLDLSKRCGNVVSVIVPVYNCVDFLEECFQSIANQRRLTSSRELLVIEVSVFDDGSTDGSSEGIKNWGKFFGKTPGFSMVASANSDGSPKGVGFAKNRAVDQSSGEYLCFCDADDIMESDRVVTQFQAAKDRQNAIVGCQFTRIPKDSTKNFTFWANSMTDQQLCTQIFQSFGPTLVMPTWFCHRNVFNRVKEGFDETGKGTPEDLIFFYQHLDNGGILHRVDQSLMVYRYHPGATTFSIKEETIWKTRLCYFERKVLSLPAWSKFSIFGAGKLGRRFFRTLTCPNQEHVIQFCDIDPKKIRLGLYEPYPNPNKLKVPIVDYRDSVSPYVVCIKTEYTWDPNSPFRQLVAEKNLVEGKDFYYFN